jgi:hypothetical protein
MNSKSGKLFGRLWNCFIAFLFVVAVLMPLSVQTMYAQAAPGPRFHVQMVENNVEGYDWPVDFPVTLTIDDPSNGAGIDFSNTLSVIPFDDDPTIGWVHFDDLGGLDLAPGMFVTMQNGATTKTHTVTDVVVTSVDLEADTVSGTGTPGVNLNVQYCDESGCLWRRWANVQPDGTWEVDFSIIGTGSDEQLILDIVPGIIGEALEPDIDNDHTDYQWGVRIPIIYAGLDHDYIYTRNWSVGVTVTLTVDNDTNPDNGYLYRSSQETTPLDGEPGVGFTRFDLRQAIPAFDLVPNQYVFLTDGTSIKDTQIVDVTFDDIDEQNDTASGTGPAGRDAEVWVETNAGKFGLDLVIDPDGNWLADFGAQDFHFEYVYWSTIDVWDDDGDSTVIDGPKTPSFGDVSTNYWASSFIERLYAAGITGGCSVSPLRYCPETIVNRAQMAVFLLRGIHGSSYSTPSVAGNTGFVDVPINYWSAGWIKQLAAEGITGGCGTGIYCPESAVTRAQMAIFLLRSKHGASYAPPGVGGSTGFGDVQPTYWAAAWIKQLVAEGITAGCGNGNYCPESPVTRAQMAVFLVRTFNLP